VSSADGLTFLSVLRKPALTTLGAMVPTAVKQHEAELNKEKTGGVAQRIDPAQTALLLGNEKNLDIHFAYIDLQHRVTACSV
jgi:hypothetical protein